MDCSPPGSSIHGIFWARVLEWIAIQGKPLNLKKKKNQKEQDGEEVGGHGVYLSPWIHQEYTIRHRNICRTPAENRQEYLTSRKEYIDPCKTQ